MDQQVSFPRRVAPSIWCTALVLGIWAGIGWWLQATPGWLAVVTGCCVGINNWRERSRGNGSPRKLLDVAVLVLFCWTLIVAGRFISNVAGVNHNIVWLAYRAASDDDGIAIVAGDLYEERQGAAMSGNAMMVTPTDFKVQADKDLREARLRWKSMNAEEKAWFIKRWRTSIDGVNEMAWSMIHRESFTVAYAGTNLLWHLAGIVVAVGLSAIPSPIQSRRAANS